MFLFLIGILIAHAQQVGVHCFLIVSDAASETCLNGLASLRFRGISAQCAAISDNFSANLTVYPIHIAQRLLIQYALLAVYLHSMHARHQCVLI